MKVTEKSVRQYMMGILLDNLTDDEFMFYRELLDKCVETGWSVAPYLVDNRDEPNSDCTIVNLKQLSEVIEEPLEKCEQYVWRLEKKGIIGEASEETICYEGTYPEGTDGVIKDMNRVYRVNPFLLMPCTEVYIEYVDPFLFTEYAKANAEFCGEELPYCMQSERKESEEFYEKYDDFYRENEY